VLRRRAMRRLVLSISLGALCLIVRLIVWTSYGNVAHHPKHSRSGHDTSDNGRNNTSSVGTLFRDGSDLEMVYEGSSGSGARGTNGIVVFLHGTSHSATDWWLQSVSCVDCIGLPEEVRLVSTALAMGYVAVAVSSVDRVNKAFNADPSGEGQDYDTVVDALHIVGDKLALTSEESRNVFIIGVSTGGVFASTIPLSGNFKARRMSVAGVICQVSSPAPWVVTNSLSSSYPPIVFVHMAFRDARTARRIAFAKLTLAALRVPSIEFVVLPHPFTISFCSRNLPAVATVGKCGTLVDALAAEGTLNARHYAVKDPRYSGWRGSAVVREVARQAGDGLIADQSGISEILNVAHASHEVCAEHASEALAWLELQATQKSTNVTGGKK
jgi:pimeloyl-ACP methyl ester carboxylesterase